MQAAAKGEQDKNAISPHDYHFPAGPVFPATSYALPDIIADGKKNDPFGYLIGILS